MTPLRPSAAALLFAASLFAASPLRSARSQEPVAPPAVAPATAPAAPQAPLPDLSTFMNEVVRHQRDAEAIRKDYIYTSTIRVDAMNKDGSIKHEKSDTYDDFTVNGVSVNRHTSHNGQPLSPDDQKKEDERIDKEVQKAKEKRAKADADGKDSTSRGDEIIPISRMFELGSFTNPRRVKVDGRDTIAVDFTGNPKAKTHNRGEEVIHDIAGTAWLDENDKTIQHLQGRFINSFKIAGGLIASVSEGTTFELINTKVNGELWLPKQVLFRGHVRFLLFLATDAGFELDTGNYRKFKTGLTILPGIQTVPPDPASPDQPKTPDEPH